MAWRGMTPIAVAALLLGQIGGLAAIAGAAGLQPALASAALQAPSPLATVLAWAAITFGLLGCVGAALALAGSRVGRAAVLGAAGGLALSGVAVPAGLLVLVAGALLPDERA